ncbi:MAG: aminotransferase class III-fold pyridoxal phosphate-dependent enzyme [Gammaproteobacteria bacterium]|nr:aminotransferase class III-fold pyridoxal phosphate-dependent enzyme [Gammaproteobacteria bacterium]
MYAAAQLNAHWMPFTANKSFKSSPRLFSHAKGVYLYTDDGREILDGTACLWCVNAGHGRKEVAEAVRNQVETMDFAPSFQFGHQISFDFANRLVEYTPPGLNHVFFTNSGSEAVDTALKIALAYQNARGKGDKTCFVSREKAYHGINFGGTALAGIPGNRKGYPVILEVDMLPHTQDLERNAFSRGLGTEGGVEKANALVEIIAQRGAENIAAVIVEPIAGAGGVVIPAQGYLERLREICDQHDILLIFDEVITGFGRTGSAFASIEFGVTPDIMTTAKGITSATIPMGGVFVQEEIYNTITNGAEEDDIEFSHGYTYSAHPVACAAGNAVLDIYERENLLTRAGGDIGKYWEDALHSLNHLPNVIDIRNYGLLGAIEFEPTDRYPRGIFYETLKAGFENGVLLRGIGNAIAMSPPLIIEKSQIDQLIDGLEKSVRQVYS